MKLTTYTRRAIHEIILDVGFNFKQLPVPAETLPELQEMMALCWRKEPESRCWFSFVLSAPALAMTSCSCLKASWPISTSDHLLEWQGDRARIGG
jgi:hypothetical protein